ncbi:hypothetical protein OH799_05980 [Nocardia sp. NBC_00881]|uniref:hypothetical protein n=1 Tax=Nocardia sp. NBC_00881 TaxID=2975995 RepID=UPI003866917D|nr:hypothetical protein OH799_05980 [Nocardia sp. NBC_00881]
MVRTRLATGLSVLGAAFILYIGIEYLLAPSTRGNTPNARNRAHYRQSRPA